MARRIEHALVMRLEIPVALLVLFEILLLFSAVAARYVFHVPLVWSDELAPISFLWLAMLGSAVAFQRQEHMRMTALVTALKGETRASLNWFLVAAALAFLVLILPGISGISHRRVLCLDTCDGYSELLARLGAADQLRVDACFRGVATPGEFESPTRTRRGCCRSGGLLHVLGAEAGSHWPWKPEPLRAAWTLLFAGLGTIRFAQSSIAVLSLLDFLT
ncbi:TRAP transporter small permease [Ensifer aridi]|uniref:TRAP transporter small permease n=1 Tax=Ensifer aridi TaxID=1708715 RepID=UPI001FCD7ADE|nr:TRAP transporter small permease subunit [Ensifer aridi]